MRLDGLGVGALQVGRIYAFPEGNPLEQLTHGLVLPEDHDCRHLGPAFCSVPLDEIVVFLVAVFSVSPPLARQVVLHPQAACVAQLFCLLRLLSAFFFVLAAASVQSDFWAFAVEGLAVGVEDGGELVAELLQLAVVHPDGEVDQQMLGAQQLVCS